MNYIIDPMWFYWMDIVSELDIICVLIAIFGGIAAVVLTVVYAMNEHEIDEFPNCSSAEQKENSIIKKYLKPIWVIAIISFIGVIFIPTDETLTKMLLAKFATYENAEIAIDGIQSAADYIINAMKEIG